MSSKCLLCNILFQLNKLVQLWHASGTLALRNYSVRRCHDLGCANLFIEILNCRHCIQEAYKKPLAIIGYEKLQLSQDALRKSEHKTWTQFYLLLLEPVYEVAEVE